MEREETICMPARMQAIESGELVDVSELAKHAGFKHPLAITAAVLALIGDIPAELGGVEDVSGRMTDLLWMASGVASKGGNPPERRFEVILPHGRERRAALKLVAGTGDRGEPVLTLMLPDES